MRVTLIIVALLLASNVSANTDWQNPITIELPAPTRSVLLDASVTVES